MKKLFIYCLLLGFLLSGCGLNRSPSGTESTGGITEPEPMVTDRQASESIPDAPTQEATMSETTEPTEAESTASIEPEQSELTEVVPTEPAKPTEPPTAKPTEPPATKPTVIEPPVTKPTVTEPPVTEPPETEPPTTQAPTEAPKPQIDMNAIEQAVERYAESIGYIYDSSLNKNNSGYYPPEYWPLTSTEQGISVGKGLLIATTHHLNSRETLDYGDELVDEIYGIVRMNCIVEYDGSDELGDWYTIYILYG